MPSDPTQKIVTIVLPLPDEAVRETVEAFIEHYGNLGRLLAEHGLGKPWIWVGENSTQTHRKLLHLMGPSALRGSIPGVEPHDLYDSDGNLRREIDSDAGMKAIAELERQAAAEAGMQGTISLGDMPPSAKNEQT